jgi:hypothetical protein
MATRGLGSGNASSMQDDNNAILYYTTTTHANHTPPPVGRACISLFKAWEACAGACGAVRGILRKVSCTLPSKNL